MATGITGARAIAIASRLALVRSEERTHPGAFSQVSSPVAGQWQVAFYSRDQEFVQVIVSARERPRARASTPASRSPGRWRAATPGAFGRDVNALWVWLPLCLLFVAPFFDWRSPLRLLNLDLLVLLSLSVSLAFFNHADIDASVPLSYPPLVYLLARLLWLLRRDAPRPPPLRLNFGARWLTLGLVVLIAFRIGLNVLELERDRRRLRQRRRRPEGARRRADLRPVSLRHHARGHLRPGRLRGLRAVRRAVGLQRALGRPARRRTRRRSSSTC